MKTVLNIAITLFNPQNAGNYASENLVFNFLRTKACPETDPLNYRRPYIPSLLSLSNSQANHVFIWLINY